ncbi:DUF3857 and transglutaminase domain-containing protein [Chitinophaga arvensicola]|uniref:Transglutaminase-like superfamily protein n=1 Tax=Chitinophaga arvensicola TaxID=29529 RepID=A0A1I0RLG5_9BACT|nr:DUF3857 and transglutaminase domain-containing protein [Chitinophaga arvensicola]SEW41208.1 Transglutaminase-like superfamily protein [Chitinophaga arvensicola]
MRYTFVMPMTVVGCLFALFTYAQDGSKMKFGKVSKEEFAIQRSEKDTGAHAIVLSEIGSSAFESDGNGLRLIYKVHRRFKIIDPNGYDVATVQVSLNKSEAGEERLQNLKAATYNLENGQIVETKLESENVFNDKQDKSLMVKRFTLPAVKPGSIIEYTFSVTSPFFRHLRSWDFQGKYPRLWSEYSVAIPEYFDYVLIPQGYEEYVVKTKTASRTTFSLRSDASGSMASARSFTVSPQVSTYKWALKDVPPINQESFITTVDNYVNRIEFQLSAYNWPDEPRKPVQSTWPQLMKDLMESEYLGGVLKPNNGFLSDKVEELTKGAKTDADKAKNIYNWVRDNYTCSNYSTMWMDKSLKSVFNSKSGNVAEINMLLVAMLKKANLFATPLLLSTRANGYVYQFYPLYTHFNYLIVGLNLGDEYVKLDASEPLMGFGKLPARCYNGAARMLDEFAEPVILGADSLREQKYTSVILGKIENGMVSGAFAQRPTYLESFGVRAAVKEKSIDEYFKQVTKSYTGEISLENKAIEDLKELESPVMIKYDFKMQMGEGDILYINPLLNEATTRNPFKAMERKFPVEMNAVYDEVFSFNMDIPDGYEVDEIPKPAIANYNENEGQFQYLIQQVDRHIQLRCRVRLTKANFTPEDYPSLREFYDLIVKKEAEQIVLKKKK